MTVYGSIKGGADYIWRNRGKIAIFIGVGSMLTANAFGSNNPLDVSSTDAVISFAEKHNPGLYEDISYLDTNGTGDACNYADFMLDVGNELVLSQFLNGVDIWAGEESVQGVNNIDEIGPENSEGIPGYIIISDDKGVPDVAAIGMDSIRIFKPSGEGYIDNIVKASAYSEDFDLNLFLENIRRKYFEE